LDIAVGDDGGGWTF